MKRAEALVAIDAGLTRIGRIANSREAGRRRDERASVRVSRVGAAVLAHLYRHGPTRVSTVAQRLELPVPRISREVGRLLADRFTAQRPDHEDGRAVRLELTPAGRRAFERYRIAADAILAEHLAGWSDTDLARFAVLLTRAAADFSGPVPRSAKRPRRTR